MDSSNDPPWTGEVIGCLTPDELGNLNFISSGGEIPTINTSAIFESKNYATLNEASINSTNSFPYSNNVLIVAGNGTFDYETPSFSIEFNGKPLPTTEIPTKDTDNEKKRECYICNKTFTRNYGLKRHMKCHFKGAEDESQTSSTIDGMNRLISIDMPKPVVKTPEVEIKSFVCSLCEKTFAKRYGLTRHLKIHIKNGTYKVSEPDPNVQMEDGPPEKVAIKGEKEPISSWSENLPVKEESGPISSWAEKLPIKEESGPISSWSENLPVKEESGPISSWAEKLPIKEESGPISSWPTNEENEPISSWPEKLPIKEESGTISQEQNEQISTWECGERNAAPSSGTSWNFVPYVEKNVDDFAPQETTSFSTLIDWKNDTSTNVFNEPQLMELKSSYPQKAPESTEPSNLLSGTYRKSITIDGLICDLPTDSTYDASSNVSDFSQSSLESASKNAFSHRVETIESKIESKNVGPKWSDKQKCKYCSKSFGGGTWGLKRHVTKVHADEVSSEEEERE